MRRIIFAEQLLLGQDVVEFGSGLRRARGEVGVDLRPQGRRERRFRQDVMVRVTWNRDLSAAVPWDLRDERVPNLSRFTIERPDLLDQTVGEARAERIEGLIIDRIRCDTILVKKVHKAAQLLSLPPFGDRIEKSRQMG